MCVIKLIATGYGTIKNTKWFLIRDYFFQKNRNSVRYFLKYSRFWTKTINSAHV